MNTRLSKGNVRQTAPRLLGLAGLRCLAPVLLVVLAVLSSCNSTPPPAVVLNFPGGTAASIDLGQSITINVTSQNDSGEGVTWSCSGAACTALANVTTSSVTFNATGVTGTATITATSKKQTKISKNFVVTVNAQLTLPTTADIQALLTASPATVGSSFNFALTSSGGTAPLTWTWSLPSATDDGLSLSSAGQITGTPATAETLSFSATVTDSSAADGASLETGVLSLLIKPIIVSSSFSFYLSGLEALSGRPEYYGLAGSVTIGSDGTVLGGEQDYNDAAGFTSPEPNPDKITGGQLTVDPTSGQGTLTLVTNNSHLGVNGTETLGVQFVNPNHALIIQFDTSATSSGSLDLQTLSSPSTPSGAFAFAFNGVDVYYNSIAAGGIFSINGANLQNGVIDINDYGVVTTGKSFSATVGSADSFGRGTITNSGVAGTIVYYVVGPEVFRFIDVDDNNPAPPSAFVGSAYGQGTAPFTASSLGPSVFLLGGNDFTDPVAEAGSFSTTPSASPSTFLGYADSAFDGILFTTVQINGTYSINVNNFSGYGNWTNTAGNLGVFNTLGIYMTDPKLNLLDPNNTTSGLGGALLADLDSDIAGGTGVLIPQTQPTASFTGNYALGAQMFNQMKPTTNLFEVDFLGQGIVSNSGVLNNNEVGILNDPFGVLYSPPLQYQDVGFYGTASPDIGSGATGRYSMLSTSEEPFQIGFTDENPLDYTAVFYQANAQQLVWVGGAQGFPVFGGTFQQQASQVTPFPAAAAAEHTHSLKLKR